MLRNLFFSLATTAVFVMSPRVAAFTLQGPLTEWQTPRLGYDVNPSTFGGPMNLGEEYRWNVPIVYYAYSPHFLNYFGTRGAAEIDRAVEILNAVPPASQLNPDDYPLTSKRVNWRASALGLRDIRSYAQTFLLQSLGLADPTRYVYTLRNRWTDQVGDLEFVFFHTIKRNFDPITWEPSSFINGQLWTYASILDGDEGSLAVTVAVDPLEEATQRHAPVAAELGNAPLGLGGFWTELTRDDVGGLRYIYRPNNYNIETAPEGSFRAGFGVGSTAGGSPWQIPGGGTGGGGLLGTNIVDVALRPGVDKVQFVRVFFDAHFGFYTTNLVGHTDRFVTNGVIISQSLARIQVAPDVIFHGADLQEGDGTDGIITSAFTTQEWVNNSQLGFGTDGNYGPGIIQPGVGGPAFVLTFNTVGRILFNSGPRPAPTALPGESSASRRFLWSSFDGSTNAPIIYPQGLSIQEIEANVLGGPSGPGGGFAGAILSPWLPTFSPIPLDNTGGELENTAP